MQKKILLQKLNNSLESIYKEINFQSIIEHPNIVQILYANETSEDFNIVLEYSSKGNLFYFIRNNKYLEEDMAFLFFIQMVNTIYFLHKNNLIHRDIKPEYILLFDNNVVKLCDFGWCVKLEEGMQRETFCGTTKYMSPELVNHTEYSKEIDVWSLGILLYEMVHGYSPFRPHKQDFSSRDVMKNIRFHQLHFKENISEECKDLIYHLLEKNPENRYKIEDIFFSDFVKYYQSRNFGFPDEYLISKKKSKITNSKSYIFSKTIDNNNQNETQSSTLGKKNRDVPLHEKYFKFLDDRNANLGYKSNTHLSLSSSQLKIKEITDKSLSCEKRKINLKHVDKNFKLRNLEHKNNNSFKILINKFNLEDQKKTPQNQRRNFEQKKAVNNNYDKSSEINSKEYYFKPIKFKKIPFNIKISKKEDDTPFYQKNENFSNLETEISNNYQKSRMLLPNENSMRVKNQIPYKLDNNGG